MSRHRDMKRYLDEYADEGLDDEDYSEDEEYETVPQPAKAASSIKAKPVAKTPSKGIATAQTPTKNQKPALSSTTPLAKSKDDSPRPQLVVTKPNSAKPQEGKSSVLEAAHQEILQGLKRFAQDNQLRISEEDAIRTLEKHDWNTDASVDELLTRFAKIKLSATQPQSAFTRALDERPPINKPEPHSIAKPWIAPSSSTTKATAASFDFSTPSPDDVVADARRRQERTGPALVIASDQSKIVSEESKSVSRSMSNQPSSSPSTAEPPKKTKAEEKRDEEDDAAEAERKPLLSLVVVGHVDAGKSTLMGHLLLDLGYVTQKDMHKFEKESKDLGKASFKYAWVMDEQAEERERGVTIDVGVKRFETTNRRVVLLDAPGHKDFVPNMITGAAQADAAVLVVPAVPGEFESSFSQGGQTKEHAILVNRLGCSKLIVAVNKMDSCGWDKNRFDFIKESMMAFLNEEVGFAMEDVQFCACSGLTGQNLVRRGDGVPDWVEQRSLADLLDALPPAKRPAHKPLRITVADAYRSMQLGPLTVSGKIEAGILRVDDMVLVSPLNENARVKALVVHGQPVRRAKAGDNVEIGLQSKQTALQDQLGQPGLVLCDPRIPVPVVSSIKTRINTLSAMKFPLLNGSQLMFHAHSVAVPCTIQLLERTLGHEGKESPRMIKKNEAAEIKLTLGSPVCLERFDDLKPLSRFLLRFSGVTVAAGVVLEFNDKE